MLERQLIRSWSSSARCAPRQLWSKPRNFTRTKSTSTGAESVNARPAPDNLSWTEYLNIRRGKHRWQTAVTIPCAIVGFAGGVAYFGTRETDATKPIMGIDPFFFYGVCTVGCAGLGWLLGPSLGTAIWRTTHRRLVTLIDARDREFYARIAKNRVDASLQTPTQPVPDYYGEKIGSLHQYRQWLRDQAKYKRKATLPEE
ncbi:hypothetical protein AX17_003911 [Amanita inopinata Kibby_2008]|nr:hypothetical protein AX17_003911 [Amanita inopinata Kibby_2008]